MASLEENFRSDFSKFSGISMGNTINFSFEERGKRVSVDVKVNQYIENNTGIHFTTYYFSSKEYAGYVCAALIEKYDPSQPLITLQLEYHAGFPKDIHLGEKTNVYSNKIYIYTEYVLHPIDIQELKKMAIAKNLHVIIRDSNHSKYLMSIQVPVAFISHDSRDKDLVARPLADGLRHRLCSVWYDEYSLKIGDSLRKSIDKGIKEVKKCILIISPNFLTNNGWTEKEFDSFFTREMILKERIILPIWYQVEAKQVYEYSPSLADTVAVKWPYILPDLLKDPTHPEVVKYNIEKEKVISKIHYVLTGT
jgi:hypothetical protein